MPPSRLRPGLLLRRIGWAVLALGLAAAAVVFLIADRADAGAAGYRIIGGQAFGNADSASTDSQSERLGGRALVRTAAFDRWLRSLFEGRRLAGTLAVLSLTVGAACLYLAGLADEEADAGSGE